MERSTRGFWRSVRSTVLSRGVANDRGGNQRRDTWGFLRRRRVKCKFI